MAVVVTQEPSALALSRSPVIITLQETNNTILNSEGFRYVLDLYIWRGSKASVPAERSHRLIKPPSPYDTAVFDIKDFLSAQQEPLTDFISNDDIFEGGNQAVNYQYEWGYYNDASGVVLAGTSDVLVSTHGYTLYNEGINADKTQGNGQYILTDVEDYVYLYDDHLSMIPVFWEASGNIIDTVQFTDLVTFDNGTDDIELAATTNSNSIGYFPLYKSYIDDLMGSEIEGDVLVELIDGSETVFKSFTLKFVCEPKYQVYTIYFTNRYGVLDFLHFFKKSTDEFTREGEDYEHNTTEINEFYKLQYNDQLPMIQDYLVDGQDSITLNTGFQDESIKHKVKQLMLSEYVLLYDGSASYPVRVDTSSTELKKGINDRMINYTMRFKYANSVINNVR